MSEIKQLYTPAAHKAILASAKMWEDECARAINSRRLTWAREMVGYVVGFSKMTLLLGGSCEQAMEIGMIAVRMRDLFDQIGPKGL